MNLASKILSFALSIICFSIFAGDPNFIKSRDIPTAEQVLKDWTPLPRKNPYPSATQFNESQLQNLTTLIAAFEKQFPGARYAVLGRDASLAGWLLDSFYTQIGSQDRVIYLKASGGTIRNASDSSRVKFLESAGINLDPKNLTTNPPVIIIDSIMHGDTSQVGYLLDAAYNDFNKNGGNPAKLAEKLVGFNMDGDGTNAVDDTNFSKQFKTIVDEVKTKQRNFPQILSANVSLDRNNEWHQGYGEMRKQSNGKYSGAVTGINSIEDRREMASTLYEILKRTKRKSFLESVKREAKNMGYEFSTKGYTPPTPPTPKYAQTLSAELSALTKDMVPVERKKHKENPNAVTLTKWMEKEITEQGSIAFLNALPFLHELKKSQKIGTRDLRELLAIGLSEIQVDSQFYSDLEPYLNQYSRIKNALKDGRKFFIAEEDLMKENYLKIIRHLPPLRSCYKSLKALGEI